jgi:hypothetical protein
MNIALARGGSTSKNNFAGEVFASLREIRQKY